MIRFFIFLFLLWSGYAQSCVYAAPVSAQNKDEGRHVRSEPIVQATATARAQGRSEACERARTMARQDGEVIGECSCMASSNGYICRVESNGPQPEESAYGTLKKELRERNRCKPEDRDCKPSRPTNAGPGIKG